MEEYDREGQAIHDNIMFDMNFARWIAKARSIHSEYVTLIAFPQQQFFS
jgi:hypothetical protein